MKTCKKCHEDKPLVEFYKHVHTKDRLRHECKVCTKAGVKANVKINGRGNRCPVKLKAQKHRHYVKYSADYKFRATLRERHIKIATPSWADLEAIKKFYTDRPEGHHVDHIVPLRGETVSGLHVESNLQWLPARENLQKGNSYV